MVNNRHMSITEVADRIGVTAKTIIRWEKAGKVKRSKRDWRGWRIYDKDDFQLLKDFKETIIYLENEEDGDGKDL